jgi:hypothetical protein
VRVKCVTFEVIAKKDNVRYFEVIAKANRQFGMPSVFACPVALWGSESGILPQHLWCCRWKCTSTRPSRVMTHMRILLYKPLNQTLTHLLLSAFSADEPR